MNKYKHRRVFSPNTMGAWEKDIGMMERDGWYMLQAIKVEDGWWTIWQKMLA